MHSGTRASSRWTWLLHLRGPTVNNGAATKRNERGRTGSDKRRRSSVHKNKGDATLKTPNNQLSWSENRVRTRGRRTIVEREARPPCNSSSETNQAFQPDAELTIGAVERASRPECALAGKVPTQLRSKGQPRARVPIEPRGQRPVIGRKIPCACRPRRRTKNGVRFFVEKTMWR